MAGYECGMKLPILYTVDLSGNPAKCIHWSVDGHLGSSLAFRLWQGVRQWTCLHMSSGVTSSFLLGLYLGLGPLGHSIGVCSVIGGIAKQMSVALLALTEVSSCCVFRACNYFLSACYASRRYFFHRDLPSEAATSLQECREDSHWLTWNMADPGCNRSLRGWGHSDIYFSRHFICRFLYHHNLHPMASKGGLTHEMKEKFTRAGWKQHGPVSKWGDPCSEFYVLLSGSLRRRPIPAPLSSSGQKANWYNCNL